MLTVCVPGEEHLHTTTNNKLVHFLRNETKVRITFIEPWNALAPTNASTARMPTDALKDR